MATMRDVAEAAGVSIATVSRVLSGSRPVNAELTERVLAAQGALGYRTNLLASGLRRQQTDTVGMVVPQVANPYFSALMQAVGRRLQRVGKTVLLIDAENDPRLEAEGMRRLLDRSVDALLAVPVDEHASTGVLSEAATRVRLVQLDRAAQNVEADLFAVDHHAGIGAVVAHLVEQDRSNLVFIGSELKDSTSRERARAFEDAVAASGVATYASLFGEYTVEWGRQAAELLLDDGALPDAIVCGNDLIALGVLAVLRECDVEVPGEVAVTGYDDIGFATLTRPALTTVRQPVDRLADAAVSRVLRPLSGVDGPVVKRFAPTLIVRASSDPSATPPHRNPIAEVPA